MLAVALAALGLLLLPTGGAGSGTDSPIIGVLTIPVGGSGCETLSGSAQSAGAIGSAGSCFQSIYVKWIESAGGRVVPLLYDLPGADLDALFDSLNGVLLTGGGLDITDPASPYVRVASRLLDRALEAHAAGVHVPVWGTCQGFELLGVLVSQESSVLERGFDSESLQLPLDLRPGAAGESRMLTRLPPEVLTWLSSENITVNLHHDGIAPAAFSGNGRLRDFFRVLSTNRDRDGRPFVSTIEGREAPVYAVQWHPERPQFQFSESADEFGINHGPHAVRAMQAFANFFVDEARMNSRRFRSQREEARNLIYNYVPQGRDAYQAYIFPPAASARRAEMGKDVAWV
uniref:folate gamma-glutamyl hydrolase n=1 Tax=Alexandrium monilatum TaxID=311494 RepID=A0A7S4Q0G6_9DINO|mmetsp:Transcript_47395/g.141461  ORF Transcript_47395/g.141461 Transcript_47395/m.141461 type:complete len:345 (-) Transcript_47395:38-1072(-)